jgi:hypothetical protein
MRYLLLLFLPIYLWHAFGEIRAWHRREAPTWAMVVMTIAKVFLTLGMVGFIFGFSPAPLGDLFFRITSVCIYFEFFFAFRSSPPKSTSLIGKIFDEVILGVLILLISGTPAFFTRLLTTKPERTILHILFFLLIAYLVARFWPSSRRPAPEPISETANPKVDLAVWLLTSPPFQRAPDEIVLADRRTQSWPGLDEVQTSLYRVRFGEQWYVALAEPKCHCFAKPIRPDASIEKIYDAYKEWYADDVSKCMMLKAAGNLGNEHFESLVNEALAKQPSDKYDNLDDELGKP